ncbi:hypothetical protein [Desulfosudis oleivorans]|uniref:Uncharacterized protein n=1 Tax=Desulfosudis oleivorans (strain DSM 6200 / JCM 39069 / Hxd3) TaxID=96561 RepID=A8ZXA6_DESOH|nr:hypothetical protein [Desulfosudis oleivorans]ABW68485.1 hypothetical protein Dole_2682 [Desulfosudis oleivorans Hxd3]
MDDMILYNDIYHWEGLGKAFGLATGRIRLRIFDLDKAPENRGVRHLRPMVVVVSDVPGESITVKGWAGPLASFISRAFHIDPHRMLWVEHYPAVQYGVKHVKQIDEIFEAVEFTWEEGVAVAPKWRPLKPPLRDVVKNLVDVC